MQKHGSKYFARRHTLDPGEGQKVNTLFFLKTVMLHTKLKGNEHRAQCTMGGVKRLKHFFFLKEVMLHIKLKKMKPKAPRKHIFCSYTYPLPQGLNRERSGSVVESLTRDQEAAGSSFTGVTAFCP